ncbi:MAG: N-acetyltransferase [Acidobacteria bacterium]|nr:N-acetyltransferase [Acidobacteriota bacterium]
MTGTPPDIAVVAGKSDLRRFVALPWRLYAGDPCWIPPLRKQVTELLDERHPFYACGAAERELFLARRSGRVVGRIAAIVNRTHNAHHHDHAGFFGFFECEDDLAAARDLLGAAAQWVKARGCDTLLGPVSPSTNYECGLLVQGFDTPPAVMMTYNPPRYADLLAAAGLDKAKDLFAYRSPVHPGSLDRLNRFASKMATREPELFVRPVNLTDFANEAHRIHEIYNAAWENNWGFVPATDGEFGWLVKELKPLLDPHLLQLAFFGDEPVGFLLALPDVNPALAALDGSLANPFRLLRASIIGRRRIGLRVITMGVKPQFRLRGAEGMLFCRSVAAAVERGYHWCEYSWILEDNELAKRTVRIMDADLAKIYRIYGKAV